MFLIAHWGEVKRSEERKTTKTIWRVFATATFAWKSPTRFSFSFMLSSHLDCVCVQICVAKQSDGVLSSMQKNELAPQTAIANKVFKVYAIRNHAIFFILTQSFCGLSVKHFNVINSWVWLFSLPIVSIFNAQLIRLEWIDSINHPLVWVFSSFNVRFVNAFDMRSKRLLYYYFYYLLIKSNYRGCRRHRKWMVYKNNFFLSNFIPQSLRSHINN